MVARSFAAAVLGIDARRLQLRPGARRDPDVLPRRRDSELANAFELADLADGSQLRAGLQACADDTGKSRCRRTTTTAAMQPRT